MPVLARNSLDRKACQLRQLVNRYDKQTTAFRFLGRLAPTRII